MDFNARMSQQFRPQNAGNGGRGKQQQNDSDAFMRLVSHHLASSSSFENRLIRVPKPDREIAGCISDIGVQFSPEDLQKPNPQQIQKVFEWFAELLMNATRETVEPAMRAAAEDVCGEYMDIVPADTRNLMGFYVSLRKLLIEVRSFVLRANRVLIDILHLVRYHRLLLQRPPQAHTRPPRQDLFVHHQLRTLSRVADCHYR